MSGMSLHRVTAFVGGTVGCCQVKGTDTHVTIPASLCTAFSPSLAPKYPPCAQPGGQGMTLLLGAACHTPAWEEELPSPTLASGSLCTHTSILLWEGSVLQVPLLVPPFLCGTCCWWKEEVQLLHQHPHG